MRHGRGLPLGVAPIVQILASIEATTCIAAPFFCRRWHLIVVRPPLNSLATTLSTRGARHDS